MMGYIATVSRMREGNEAFAGDKAEGTVGMANFIWKYPAKNPSKVLNGHTRSIYGHATRSVFGEYRLILLFIHTTQFPTVGR